MGKIIGQRSRDPLRKVKIMFQVPSIGFLEKGNIARQVVLVA